MLTPRKRILVVEDEKDTSAFIATLLEDNGYETIVAANGVEGWKLVQSERPDLITLDISLPEESGVRLYRDLKSDSSLASIPVIIVTGLGQPFKTFIERRRQVPDPEGFISKPFQERELLDMVARLLLRG